MATETLADETGVESDNSDSASLAENLAGLRDRIESADSDRIADMADVDLVELRTELKALESDVNDMREDVVDDELTDRIEPGESLFGLNHIESHNKYLAEDAGTVIMRMVSDGMDWTEYVDVNASSLASDHPDLAEIGRYEYTYLR